MKHAAKGRSSKATRRIIISAGGLEDEDADAANPFPTQKVTGVEHSKMAADFGNLKRDLSRQNTVRMLQLSLWLNIDSDFSKLVSMIPEEGEPAKQASRRPLRAVQSEKKTHAPVKSAAKNDDKENSTRSSEANIVVDKTKKRRLLTTNNVRVTDLPDFAQNQTWKKAFLPALFAKFFSSKEPFAHFAKGSDAFIALLQEVVKEVYPKINYKVSARDAIHALVRSIYLTLKTGLICFLIQAYNRINEKRSLIGSSAVDMIVQYTSTLQGEKAVREWLLWASRGDGPLYFREPVAPDAPRDTEDPQYVVSVFSASCLLSTDFGPKAARRASDDAIPDQPYLFQSTFKL